MRYSCPSAIFDYLGGQMGDKTGENLQISELKIKNLQKWAQFLMPEIKRFTSFVCRYYVFLYPFEIGRLGVVSNNSDLCCKKQ